jgi:hypothetical protein
MDIKIDPRSVLLLTLDSCRYDTFVSADAPNFHALGPVFRAMAPSYFTYGSHAAMFVGFTPGVAERREAVINPKVAKLFRVGRAAFPGHAVPGFALSGRSVPEGFRLQDYAVLGSGAARWFDPTTPTGRNLTADFDEFFYPERVWGLGRQLAWVESRLRDEADKPIFLFLNIGETHVPYYFEGAPWSPGDNPCVPFQAEDRREECRLRQRACLEYVDRQCKPLLDAFAGATIMVTADHGDCWGEDGLWEHGVSHEMTLTVPLVYRLGKQF